MKSSLVGLATALFVTFSGGAIAQTVVAANTLLVSTSVKQVADLRKDPDRVSELGGSGRLSTFMTGRYGSHEWVVSPRMFSMAGGTIAYQPEALLALDFASGN